MTLINMPEQTLDARAAHIESLFPTHLITHQWGDADGLNASLCNFAKSEMAKTSGMCQTTTNVGGWHSEKSLSASPNLAVQTLLRRFEALVGEATARIATPTQASRLETDIDMWCNVNREHHYNEPHVHRDCTWVGVYYADVPANPGIDPRAGALEVFDPRPAAMLVPMPGAEFDLTRLITPKAGLMVLFPSFLTHMVHPFPTQGQRVSFASNIKARLG